MKRHINIASRLWARSLATLGLVPVEIPPLYDIILHARRINGERAMAQQIRDEPCPSIMGNNVINGRAPNLLRYAKADYVRGVLLMRMKDSTFIWVMCQHAMQ